MVAEKCKQGHPLTPENVRINRRTGHRSGCIKCSNYSRERRRAASPGSPGRKRQESCKEGHPLTLDNVRIDQKGRRRGCLTCTPVRRGPGIAEKCKKGHPFTPDNVIIDSRGHRKGCKACLKARGAQRNARLAEQRRMNQESAPAVNAEWFDWVAVYRASTGVKAVGRELYPLEVEALIPVTMDVPVDSLSDWSGLTVNAITVRRAKIRQELEPVDATEDAPEEPDFLAGAFTLSAVAPILPGYVPVFATLAPAAGGVGVEPAVA